jgi:hypothetical protein
MTNSNVARNIQFTEPLLGSAVQIDLNIENCYRTSIDFTLFGLVYTFTIDKWARRGLSNFLQLFHQDARDPVNFGLMIEAADGTKQFFANNTDITQHVDRTYTVGASARAMTANQKLNCVEQGCRDVLLCLDKNGRVHQRCILDYCVWYREGHRNPATYSGFITLITSQSVVHNDFMAPNVKW